MRARLPARRRLLPARRASCHRRGRLHALRHLPRHLRRVLVHTRDDARRARAHPPHRLARRGRGAHLQGERLPRPRAGGKRRGAALFGRALTRVLDARAVRERAGEGGGRPVLLRRLRPCGRDGRSPVLARHRDSRRVERRQGGLHRRHSRKGEPCARPGEPRGPRPAKRLREPRRRRGRHRHGQAPSAQLRSAPAVLRAQGARACPRAAQPRQRRAVQRLRARRAHAQDHAAEAPASARGHRPRSVHRPARPRGGVRHRLRALRERSRLRVSLPHRRAIPNPVDGRLAFDARYCIGCGLCVPACAFGAVALMEATAELFLPDAGSQGGEDSETQRRDAHEKRRTP